MIFSFTVTTIIFLVNILLYLFSVFAFIIGAKFGIPKELGLIVLVVSIITDVFLAYASQKLYNQSLKRRDYDIEGFLAEQKKISSRSFGRAKTVVDFNIINGYFTYRRYNEAESYLLSIQPKLMGSSKVSDRMFCLLFMLTIQMYKNNQAAFDGIVNEMKRLMLTERFDSPAQKKFFEENIQGHILEFSFFTRTPKQLVSTDRVLTERFRDFMENYFMQNKNQLMKDSYNIITVYRLLGTIYAVLGDKQRENYYFNEIAKQDFAYPDINQVRQYLQSGNIDILFDVFVN